MRFIVVEKNMKTGERVTHRAFVAVYAVADFFPIESLNARLSSHDLVASECDAVVMPTLTGLEADALKIAKDL